MRDTVIDILALAGFKGQGYGSAAAAHEAMAYARPDMAVLDQRLPDTTGTELAASLRAADPDMGVLLVTGYASTDSAIAAVGVVDDYLMKPVAPDDFVRRVKAVIDRTRLRRENRLLVARLREMNTSLEATVARRTAELRRAHQQALEDQAARERLQAQAERERLENRLHQSQRLESLGQLAGGVAHDFNNLLAVILNCAAFVAEATADNEAVRADVEQIRNAAERAADLTRQLLIFGRRERVRLKPLDINSVVADVQGLLARSIGEHVKLVVHSVASLPPIRADRGQVGQVLVNLAVNARDAMPDGGTLTIEPVMTYLDGEQTGLFPPVSPGCYVGLAVTDDGTGMSPEVLTRIFEPFFTTKPQGKGTGLGMATVHGIVSAAGGGLSVQSALGTGTTVRAYFPVADEAAESAAEPGTIAQESRGRGETILVVEDEPAVLGVAVRILERNSYRVLRAETAAHALALAGGQLFDLLLSDLVMPDMSGLELAGRVRQARPGARVLFMSGYSQDVWGSRGVNGEDIRLVQKPFTERALLEGVRLAMTAPPGGPHR
jgi:hypothetical protein